MCMFIYVYFCFLFSPCWVCWVCGNFSGGPGHILSVCVSPPCRVPGRYNFIWALHGVDGGTVQIFLFLWLCCSGNGTVEMVKGVVRLFLLSLVCCQFSWRLDVCGRNFAYIFRFSLVDLWCFSCGFVFFQAGNFLNSLQVVQAESELGRPGTSA
jgi:hypothetical protein